MNAFYDWCERMLSAFTSLINRCERYEVQIRFNRTLGRIELVQYEGSLYRHRFTIGVFTYQEDILDLETSDMKKVLRWADRKLYQGDFTDGCHRVFLIRLLEEGIEEGFQPVWNTWLANS